MRFDSLNSLERPSPSGDARVAVTELGSELQNLAALHDRYAPVMLSLGLRILRDRPDAEDLVHDVLLEVWQSRHDFDPRRGTLQTWILTRTRSRAIDRLRRSARRGKALEGHGESVPGSLPADPVRNVEQGRAIRALAALTAQQREIVRMAYFDGLTYREISAHSGVPLGTVKSRMQAAIRRLRQHLDVAREPGA